MFESHATKVVIIMGSNSDFSVFEGCLRILNEFDIKYEVLISCAHQSPDRTELIAKDASQKGIDIIIAGSKDNPYLAGAIASYTPIPIIGVPMKVSGIDGYFSLLPVIDMPKGVPIATVAINATENAALLAVQILSVSNQGLRDRYITYKNKLAKRVEEKDLSLKEKMLDKR
jgi:5-(carboxyamino)imidazole ribonucleotide mutase